MDVLKTEISKLSLGPDDILVLKYRGRLSSEQAHQVRQRVRSVLPEEVPVLVIDEGIELSVVKVENQK